MFLDTYATRLLAEALSLCERCNGSKRGQAVHPPMSNLVATLALQGGRYYALLYGYTRREYPGPVACIRHQLSDLMNFGWTGRLQREQ